MSKKDPRVDAYIAKAQSFAQATRETRITTAVEWMAEGKTRNWKYMK